MPLKSTTTTEWGERKKRKKIQKNLQNTSKNKNNKCFLESLLSESFPSLRATSPPHFPRMASNTVLISGPVVGAVQILIWSYSMFLPLMSTAIRTSDFLLWELSMTFYIFHRHRVCLVDRMDLI